jgi:hypothetical protein
MIQIRSSTSKRGSVIARANKNVRTVFQVCPGIETAEIKDIERVLMSTRHSDYRKKTNTFISINVNYNQVVKWYSYVRQLEDLYNEEYKKQNKGVFDLVSSDNTKYVDIDTIENCIINTKRECGNTKLISFACHNLNYDKVIKWYPTIRNLERSMKG